MSLRTILAIACVYLFIFALTLTYLNRAHGEANKLSKLEISRDASDPVSIFVPKIKLAKTVKPGIYDFKQNKWLVTDNYPHFATISAKPNSQSGNTILYAHNSNGLFGKLHLLKKNDLVILKTKNGKRFVYVYEAQKDVLPADVSVFKEYEKPRLTLITCVGKNNSLRRLFYFRLVQAV